MNSTTGAGGVGTGSELVELYLLGSCFGEAAVMGGCPCLRENVPQV